jgi:hypothetical protein
MRLDVCPHCQNRLEIVCVKFSFVGAMTVSACPNCGLVASDDRRAPSRKSANIIAKIVSSFSAAFDMIEALNARFRYVVAFVVAAVLTAAVLRHVLHVYGGLPREEIRADAIMALLALWFLSIVYAMKRRH